MLKFRISSLREAWGLSQAAFGHGIGVSGAYISALELGKNSALSPGSIKLISRVYLVDEEWVLTGKMNLLLCHAIRDSLGLNPIEAMAAAGKVPVAFIAAIRDAQISPSTELIDRLNKARYQLSEEKQKDLEKGVGPADPGYVKHLEAEVQTLRETVHRYGQIIDELRSQLTKGE